MAQITRAKLDSRENFPEIQYDLVGGGTMQLPTKSWTVALFYRGYW